ncbi:hypothetical protein NKH77_38980 [Streptomyces sp. M19]
MELLRRTLDDELTSFPDDDALRTAHALVVAAADAAHRAHARHEERTRTSPKRSVSRTRRRGS